MRLRVLDSVSVAGSGVNEDRAGAGSHHAWVIDGATDVLDRPLTGAETDAAWIATQLDMALHDYAKAPTGALDDLPAILTRRMARSFARDARRSPESPHEHPSAAGLIVECRARELAYIGVSDCTLIAASREGAFRYGVSPRDAGDFGLAISIEAHRKKSSPGTTPLIDAMRPTLQEMRAGMNREGGYGVFSITQPPASYIHRGRIAALPGTRLLLATDGFMRLVDVFGTYTPAALVTLAGTHGLKGLVDELRMIERSDGDGTHRPRIKASDDATALLLEVQA